MNMAVWREIFETDLENRGIYDVWDFHVDKNYYARRDWIEYVQCCPARFRCSICSHFWASSKVHILFHIKLKSQTGQVRMHVFKQKCNKCNAAEYEEPTFIAENIEIAIGYLVNRISQEFYNLPIDDLPKFLTDAFQYGSHDSSNCEGCALGICKCNTFTKYSDKRLNVPKRTNQVSKPKKKIYSHPTNYHQGASQYPRTASLDRKAAGTDVSSHGIVDVPGDDPSVKKPCCIIL